MPEIKECLKVRSQVTCLKALQNNTVAIGTQIHGIQIFQADTCQNKQTLSIAQLHHKTTAFDIHPNKNICAVVNDTVIYIVSLINKSVLQTIFTHNSTIEMIVFVPDRPYIISTTKEGRVMLYRYDGHSEISRLLSFTHYVSTFALSQNYMACSGYGGCVSLVLLNSHKQIRKYCISKVRVDSLCFIHEETLLFGNVEGTLYLQSLQNKENVFTITMPFSNIKHIIHFPASDFALVSGKSNTISLVNVTTRKLISAKYLMFHDEVHTMTLTHDQYLIVVLKSKQIYRVKFANAQDLKVCIVNKNIQKAFEIIDSDPRFQGTKEHKRAEILYEKLYADAFNALVNENTKSAQKMIAPIKNIYSKRDTIKLLYKAYDNYAKFKSFYCAKKYALAYNLSDKFPALKYTPQYKKMQEEFKEAYTFAQKQILLGRKDVAKDALVPYITVLSKRTLINLLLRQNKEFLEFLKALQNKDYKLIHSLVSKYETFKDIPGYLAVQKSQETLLKNIATAIDNAKVEAAIQQIKSLQSFTCNENALEELYDYALSVKKLLTNYENNNFKTCYALIDNDERLQKLEVVKLLEEHWQKLMNECEKYALSGDIQSIKETLHELISIPSRAQRTGDLLRLSFYTQIRHLININKFTSAENLIYSYIDIFGIDKELTVIMQHYETYSSKKLAITHEQGKKRTRDSWLHSDIL
jgi:hypothetical protein